MPVGASGKASGRRRYSKWSLPRRQGPLELGTEGSIRNRRNNSAKHFEMGKCVSTSKRTEECAHL